MIIRTVDNFLTEQECKEVISLIEENNQRSSIAGEEKNTRIITKNRTSNTSFLSNKNTTVNFIKEKISKILNIDIKQIESLQGIKYISGQYFLPHRDGYEGIRKQNLTKESGNRIWSLLIYLNEDYEGGETGFPLLNLDIKPKKGMALMWHNLKENGDLLDESLHEGKLVVSGTKYIITTCIREREFTTPSIIGDNVNSDTEIKYINDDS